MFSIIYGLIILLVAYYAVRNNKMGVYWLIALLPFYTILREMTGGQIVFYLWPYFIIGIYLLQIAIDQFKNNDVLQQFSRPLKTIVYYFIPAYYVLLFIFTGVLGKLFFGGPSGFASLMTDNLIIMSLLPLILFFLLFFYTFLLTHKRLEKKLLLADIFVVMFLLYGLMHIAIAYFDNRSLFNALTQFRYYFAMGFIYFLVREYITTSKEYIKIAKIGVVVFYCSLLFNYVESALLNWFDVEPNKLPWTGALAEIFEYKPDRGSVRPFLDAKYSAMGLMYSQHLSGLLLALGFALYYPFLVLKFKLKQKPLYLPIIILVIILPICIVYTSKTVLIIYAVSIIAATFLCYRRFFVAVPIGLLFLTVIPWVYANYLLPGMKYDVGREFSYLTAGATPVFEYKEPEETAASIASSEQRKPVEQANSPTMPVIKEYDKDDGIKNKKNISDKDDGLFSCIYCDANTDQRVLNNAFVNLLAAITDDVDDLLASTSVMSSIFGQGYSLSDWTKKLKANDSSKTYEEVSQSDTPYLKFFQQFGLVGLLIFVMMGLVICSYGLYLWWVRGKNNPYIIGLSIITPLALLATMHLQIYFKTGLNSVVFVTMALLVTMKANTAINPS